MMKKIVERVTAVIAVAALVIGIFRALDYILTDDTASYTRLMEHEFYNQENIDILCVGASHCFRGIIPSVVSEKTGKNVFVASSSAQAPDASYALIKEAARYYDVKEVYLEISAAIAEKPGYKERTNLKSTYIVSDYMRPSLNKALFLLNASASEYYINSFFPARRNWSSVFDFPTIVSLMKIKRSDAYRSYSYETAETENEWYAGNGYVANNLSVEEHQYYTKDGFEKTDIGRITEDWKNSVNSIISFCSRNHIKLVLINLPVSNFELASKGNHDEYISFVKEFLNGRDVEYVDFNLLKEDYWQYKQSNYEDGDHMNMYGAARFSEFLSSYMNGEIPDTAFYNSAEEKLKEAPPEYYGISFKDNPDDNTRTIRLVSNHPEYFEYKVGLLRNDGKTDLLQDYSSNCELTFSKDISAGGEGKIDGTIIVSCRAKGSDSEILTAEYKDEKAAEN